MDSIKAFTHLAEHADKQHAFVVGRIGQEAVTSALEFDALSTEALLSLSDEDFERYMESSDDAAYDSDNHYLDPYLDAQTEFSQHANALFDVVDGYSLLSADEQSVVVHKVLKGQSLSVAEVERLSIIPLGDQTVVRKVRQTVGGIDAGTVELAVTPDDETTAEAVLARLARVNNALSESKNFLSNDYR